MHKPFVLMVLLSLAGCDAPAVIADAARASDGSVMTTDAATTPDSGGAIDDAGRAIDAAMAIDAARSIDAGHDAAATRDACTPVSGDFPYGAYGSYRPGPTTTGVRPCTTLIPYTNQFGAIVNGQLTLRTAGVTISGYDIPALIVVQADSITIDNCLVRGPPVAPTGVANFNLITSYTGTNLVVQDCTLAPDFVNHNAQGIQGHGFLAQRNNIYNTVDGIDPTGGNGMMILANYIHDLSWFSPDTNHMDGHSHNDCIQFEGGSVTVRYNNLQGFLSPTVGDGPARPYDTSNSVMLMVTGTSPATTMLDISSNWIDGGEVALNVGVGPYTMLGTVANNTVGDNQGSRPPLVILMNNPRASIGLTITNNVYGVIERPLAMPSRAGTVVATGNGISGG